MHTARGCLRVAQVGRDGCRSVGCRETDFELRRAKLREAERAAEIGAAAAVARTARPTGVCAAKLSQFERTHTYTALLEA